MLLYLFLFTHIFHTSLLHVIFKELVNVLQYFTGENDKSLLKVNFLELYLQTK
jgi:hypothetical protein